MFAWFVMSYGRTTAKDCKTNCTAMAMEWHLTIGFKLLIACLFRGTMFAKLVQSTPSPARTLLILAFVSSVALASSWMEYKAWVKQGNNISNSMNFAAFCSFWGGAMNIVLFTATKATQHGYGMNAAKDDASTTLLTDAISKFGAAYAATQETLHNNNAAINSMQGQIQMICSTIRN